MLPSRCIKSGCNGPNWGWAGSYMNLMGLVSAGALATWGGMEIARVIGVVVFPLGGLLGWF